MARSWAADLVLGHLVHAAPWLHLLWNQLDGHEQQCQLFQLGRGLLAAATDAFFSALSCLGTGRKDGGKAAGERLSGSVRRRLLLRRRRRCQSSSSFSSCRRSCFGGGASSTLEAPPGQAVIHQGRCKPLKMSDRRTTFLRRMRMVVSKNAIDRAREPSRWPP